MRAQSVRLDLLGCPAVAEAELRGLVELELRVSPQLAEPITVVARCDGERAELRVLGSARSRAFSLVGVPEALRARLLALSIAELSRGEPTPPPLPEAAPTPPLPAQIAPRPLPARPTRHGLWIGIAGTALPLYGLGGALLWQARIARRLAWSSALDVAQTRAGIDRGTLRVRSAGLRTGPAFFHAVGPLALQLGAGLRLGWLNLQGEPADRTVTVPDHVHRLGAAVALFGGATWELPRRLLVGLTLELDRAFERVRADVVGGGARTLSAYRLGATLGGGVRW